MKTVLMDYDGSLGLFDDGGPFARLQREFVRESEEGCCGDLLPAYPAQRVVLPFPCIIFAITQTN